MIQDEDQTCLENFLCACRRRQTPCGKHSSGARLAKTPRGQHPEPVRLAPRRALEARC